jgi:predicted membrane protein (TIGR00267 family)
MAKTIASPPPELKTKLGRAARAAQGGGARQTHAEPHRGTNWLRDVILGGQDGLVNILGIILGVIAGGGSTTVLLVTGLAAAITESISMGAVGYTSSVAVRDFYRAEQGREQQEIESEPDIERAEVREIYAAKGFSGDLLDQVVDTIVANRDLWVDTMMSEELHLQPVETRQIARTSVVITVATLIGHVIPLVPFVFLDRPAALVVAFVLSAITLFAVGAYSAITLVGDWRMSGAKMVAIGLGAAIVGYAVSALVNMLGGAHAG